MAGITGKDGSISLGGSAVNGKVRSWRLTYEGTVADTTGAGDAVEEQTPLRKRWRISGEFVALDQADWDLDQGLVGTIAAIAVKRKSADTSAYASGTGVVTQFEVNAPYDGATIVTFEVQNNGTDLTFDTTPA